MGAIEGGVFSYASSPQRACAGWKSGCVAPAVDCVPCVTEVKELMPREMSSLLGG